jgi:hypothetical protein
MAITGSRVKGLIQVAGIFANGVALCEVLRTGHREGWGSSVCLAAVHEVLLMLSCFMGAWRAAFMREGE